MKLTDPLLNIRPINKLTMIAWWKKRPKRRRSLFQYFNMRIKLRMCPFGMMVPIIDFAILEKFNIPLVPLSSMFQVTKRRKHLSFNLMSMMLLKRPRFILILYFKIRGWSGQGRNQGKTRFFCLVLMSTFLTPFEGYNKNVNFLATHFKIRSILIKNVKCYKC